MNLLVHSASFLRRAFPCLSALFVTAALTVSAADFAVTPYVQNPSTNAMTILFFTRGSCNATVKCGPCGAGGAILEPSQTRSTAGVWA